MFYKLSFKVLLGTIALVVICSISFLYLNMKEHEDVYRANVLDHLSALSANMADDLVAAMSEDGVDRFALTTRLLDLEVYSDIRYAIVYDRDWNMIQKYISPEFMPQASDAIELPSFNVKTIEYGVSVHEGSLTALRMIGDEDYLLGNLLIVNSYQEPLDESNRALVASSLPIAFFILLVTTVMGTFFSRRLLDPLSRLTDFTESIENSSDYHQRFETHGRDEVANLGNNINSMLSRIDEQNARLKEQVSTLEEQQESLRKLANFDALTELPNRKFFMEVLKKELSRAKRRDNNVIILFLDLDNFKEINDSLGHEAGDSLLIKVSQVITSQLRDSDMLARLGGDEFLILLSDINESILDMGVQLAERIIHSLEIPIIIRDWEIQTGVSIGIADAASADYQEEALIRNADVAMYHAKGSGRNTYAFFQQQLQAESMRKMLIANALAKALSDEEFSVVYQIKVTDDSRVNGVEALIRWDSSFDGLISPAEFIPVAEHSGKITPISRWVMQRVFRDLPQLKCMMDDDFVVSINLSTHDIRDHQFIKYIKDKVHEYDVDPRCIEFEITESAYLDNFDEATLFFREIAELNFSIALDDFGTGYSSMSYLTRIRIDTLKIDRAFVSNLDDSPKDRLIIEAIIGLAHKLELNICAEGVETAAQRDYLAGRGCHQQQGYFYGKPVALTELPNVIESVQGVAIRKSAMDI